MEAMELRHRDCDVLDQGRMIKEEAWTVLMCIQVDEAQGLATFVSSNLVGS